MAKRKNRRSWLRPIRPMGRDQRGIGFLGMLLMPALMAIIMLVLMGVVAPAAMKTIMNGVKFPELLVHVPLMPQGDVHDEVLESAKMGGLNTAMGDLYGSMQAVGLAGLAIALVLAGFYYMFESIHLVSEGTASRIIAESFIILILIFAFPTIWNAAATVVNGLNSNVIFGGWEQAQNATQHIKDVVVTPAFEGGGLEGVFLQLFVVFGVMMSFIGIIVGGTLRLFMIGALAVGMPLLLVMRLFPFLRGLSNNLINTLIGLLVASIFASIFLVFTHKIITTPGMGGITMWGIAFGGITVASLAPMIFAPAVGRTLSTATHTVAAGVAGAVAGGASMLGGTVVGGAAGLRYGAPGVGGGRIAAGFAGAAGGAWAGASKAIPVAGGLGLGTPIVSAGGGGTSLVGAAKGNVEKLASQQLQPHSAKERFWNMSADFKSGPSAPEDAFVLKQMLEDGRIPVHDIGRGELRATGFGSVADNKNLALQYGEERRRHMLADLKFMDDEPDPRNWDRSQMNLARRNVYLVENVYGLSLKNFGASERVPEGAVEYSYSMPPGLFR